MKSYVLIFAVALALTFTFCKKNESYDNTASSSTGTTATDTSSTYDTSGTGTATTDTSAPGTTSAASTPLSKEDSDFAMKAAQGNMAEVNAGTTAASKGTSPDVKNFGNRMVTDHGKALDDLKQLALTKGLTLPTDLGAEQKAQIDKLSKLSGSAFDKAYADTMVKDHEKDAKEIEKGSKDAKDPDLKAWAAKVLPVIQDHLKMAKDMKSKVK